MKKLSATYADLPISTNKKTRKEDYRRFLFSVAEEIGLNENHLRRMSMKDMISLLKKIAPKGCVFSDNEFGSAGYKLNRNMKGDIDSYYDKVIIGRGIINEQKRKSCYKETASILANSR